MESLMEESEGTLASNPALEEALREAADALDETGRVAHGDAEEASAPAAPQEASADPGPAGDEMEKLRAEAELAHDRLMRMQADFENFRRRALKEKTEDRQFGHQNLVKDLLSTVDNLERAIDHARVSGEDGGGDLESLLQGVELVQRELLGALGKHGVFEIEAAGKPFDPSLHEAMAQAPDDSVAPNTVVQVLEKGYKLRSRLIRPARVIVAQAPEGSPEPEAETVEDDQGVAEEVGSETQETGDGGAEN
jgi:molecular chaperone GrpE